MNKMNAKTYRKTCLSYFTVKWNRGAYGLFMAPNIRILETYFLRVLQMASGIKALVMSN